MKLSIRVKTVIMIIVFAFVLITIAIGMYARVILNLTDRLFKERADDLAATSAGFLDAAKVAALRAKVEAVYNTAENKVNSDSWGEDDWNEYMALFAGIEQEPEFIELREELRKLQSTNSAKSIYIGFVDPVNECDVYLVDGAYEGACPPGCIDVIYEQNYEVIQDPERGFPAYTTDTETYGKLITAGAPIYYEGNVVAYAMCDFSLDELHGEQATSIWKLYGYLAAVAVIICLISIFVVKNSLVKPIKALTEASRSFAAAKSDPDFRAFADVKVNTRDELEELAESMKNMEVEINGNMRELVEMNRKLAASQNVASEMSELANKDALTGVRNKTFYDRIAEKMDEHIQVDRWLEFGVAMIDLNSLKYINDTYGHNAGDVAIIKLSKLICGVFVHSPVFRIGGDEFAVILQNEDYKNADQLLLQFRESVKAISQDTALPPEERVSAAAGFARFNPDTDSSFSQVFNRADDDMYRRKSEMKKEMQ